MCDGTATQGRSNLGILEEARETLAIGASDQVGKGITGLLVDDVAARQLGGARLCPAAVDHHADLRTSIA